MQIVRMPNITLKTNKQMNEIDNMPFKGESLDRNGIGPHKKNLLIPIPEDNKLRIKVKSGRADLKSR